MVLSWPGNLARGSKSTQICLRELLSRNPRGPDVGLLVDEGSEDIESRNICRCRCLRNVVDAVVLGVTLAPKA